MANLTLFYIKEEFVFALDSIQNDNSKIFVLHQNQENWIHKNSDKMLFVIKEDKILHSELYDKEKLQDLINKTCSQGKNVYINPKKQLEFLVMEFKVPLDNLVNKDKIDKKVIKVIEIDNNR